MQFNIKGNLLKRLDEYECTISWTSGSSIPFLLDCLEDYKIYFLQLKAQQEAEEQKKKEEQESKNVS